MKHDLELVAPGGSLEKIEYAYHYGADAVYLGLPDFSLRARLNDFTPEKLQKAADLARQLKKKIYLTFNIYAHERHLKKLEKNFAIIKKISPDALIISDPGILRLVREKLPKIKIHLSTQASTTNSEAVKFWQAQGVSRVVLAREVTLQEIKLIRKRCPKIELECFVHGAMCMSYSGRCLLSKWLENRSANLGDCVQPCRWAYSATSEVRLETRDNERKIIEVCEDQHGTYFMNSKDLCLISYVDKLAEAGVNAFKIEGRTKSTYYVAMVTKAYGKVLEVLKSRGKGQKLKSVMADSKSELEKLTNRGYTTGFLLGKEGWDQNFENSHNLSGHQFVGQVENSDHRIYPFKSAGLSRSANSSKFNRVKVHNALVLNDKVEVITPGGTFPDEILEISDVDRESVISAHGGNKSDYLIKMNRIYGSKALLRKPLD